MDNLTKILKEFGKKWVKLEESYDIAYIKKRKRVLIKWVIKKLFLH